MTDPPLRILVVDPSPAQRRVAQVFLPDLGATVFSAADGLEGWELCQTCRPHLLFTELALSGISGVELIRRCKAFRPTLRVLVLTAAVGEWATGAAFAAGADHLLLKPADWGEVLRQCRLLVRGEEKELEAILITHGAPAGRAGLRQAARCAALLARRECALLKEAYIQVAAEERSSSVCVAKNIERFVKDCAAMGCLAFLGFPAAGPPPGNRAFLSALARYAIFPLELRDKE